MQRIRPLLAATLIVRDEAHQLAECLASLEGLVDEVVVYDTGSRDGTPELARRAGARVMSGYWDEDFGRARNAALGMTRARWSLSVDADERVVADATALRGLLLGRLDGLLLRIVNRDAQGRFQGEHAVLRLARTEGAHWDGRVHEVLLLQRPDASKLLLPAGIAHIEHLGYRDTGTIRAKAERNLALSQAELDRLFSARSRDRAAGARVLLDLARSALELGRRQMAVDALEALREIVPDGPHRTVATALLAQVLLDAGGLEDAVLVLEAELRADPRADPRLVDWLRAQALVRLDRPDEALVLLRRIDRLVDAIGIEQPFGRVLRARAVLAAHAGHRDEARTALLAAMLDHGVVAGNGELLLTLYRDDPEGLAAVLDDARTSPPGSARACHLPELLAELTPP